MARGLFRLWLVLTAIWFALMAATSSVSDVIEHFPNVAAPPAIILAIGFALAWVFQGFRA